MADLTARFRMIDEMSAALERVAQSGQDMTDRIGQGAADIDSAMAGISLRVSGVARTIDGVATSIDQAEDAQADLTAAMERAAQVTQELSDNENVSAEVKDELARASQEAEDALNELATAQERAQQAMDEYDRLLTSGTASLDELEQAAQNAANASDELDAANRRATRATEELADATDRAADEAEESGERGQNAAEMLGNALAAAGVTAMVHEMADAFMEASAAAAEFQMAVMKISTIADTTSVSLDTIQSDIMALSMETGDSVNELSEAVYSAISASVDTASAVDFTATATKLAAGGFTSSATAVDVLTTALNAYGLEADKAENIADMLITTQNLGKTTVDELAASVGKVIPLASAYGVEMDNLSAAYAELTKGGIATAESGTYLKSMLNELGDSGSTVSAVLMEQTGSSFSALMEQGYSLGDVMEILGESVNGNAGAFNELWSSSEAGIGALSLYNAGAGQFNATLNAMQTSVGATSQAYDIMNNTTADAAEDLSNAADNLQISIGQQINPLIEKLYGLGTNILNFMTEFTQEHPVVTKAIAAIGIGLGVAATAMVTVTIATTTAIPAIVSFGVALNTALGPIGWVAIGITALTAAVAAFIAMNEENLGETEGMTAVTRAQYYELQDLNAEYERACEQYGETSDEALRLKNQVDDLSSTFEANRQTVEEFTAEADALCEGVSKINATLDENKAAIRNDEIGTLALIQKYEDLSSSASDAGENQAALTAISSRLADSFPDVAAQFDSATMSADDYVEAMKKACEQEAELQRQQQEAEAYSEALQKQAQLENEIAKAEENMRLEKERMDNMSGWSHFWTSGEYDDLEAYQEALDKLYTAQEENNALIAETERGWREQAKAASELQEAEEPLTEKEIQEAFQRQVDALQAVQTGTLDAAAAAKVFGVNENELNSIAEQATAYNEKLESAVIAVENGYMTADEAAKTFGVTLEAIDIANAQTRAEELTQRMQELGEAYTAAYDSAYSSFQGQFGLFDNASTKSEEYMNATVANAQAAMESQLAYWESYGTNIESLKAASASDLGITQENYNALMSYVQDGSEQAAGLAASMAAAIEAGDTEAVANLANTIAEVSTKQEEIASSTADWQTNFTEQMNGYQQDMADIIADMDLSEEAATAATSTVTSYAEQILAGKTDAVSAAEEVARAVTSAFSSAKATVNVGVATGSIPGHANGTTNAEDIFIAGEDGPELIVGAAHSTVFPASETDRLINAVTSNYDNRTTSYTIATPETSTESDNSGQQEKHITLGIAGGSPIEVNGGGASKEDIVEALISNLRPALLNLIKDEIFEEGDGSYEY